MEGRPGLESRDLPEGDCSVVASVVDMDGARLLVEALEEEGVPPGSIALLGQTAPEEDTANEEMPESGAFMDVTKSAIAGGAAGAVAGAVLGWLASLAIGDLGLVLAVVLGAIFGAGIGGSAGGMAVAKYNSPAWRESYETVDGGAVSVGVHDGDSSVIDLAYEIMERHEPLEIRRSGDDAS